MNRCSRCDLILLSNAASCPRCGGAATPRVVKPPPARAALARCPACDAILAPGSTRCIRCKADVGRTSRAASAPGASANQPVFLTSYQTGDEMVDALAEPSDDEVAHWFHSVRLSSPVTCNPDYATLADSTEIFMDRESAALNAYAAHPENSHPHIVVYGGIVRAYALTSVAAALALEECDGSTRHFAESFKPRFRRVATCIMDRDWELDEGTGLPSAVFPVDRASPHSLIQQSRTHLTGMMLTLIAHELGHVVLRHGRSNVPPGGSPAQLAMEHQADAFARAVCESVPFQSEVTFAGFLDALLWPWISPGDVRPTTHPGAKSRLFRFVDENEELAKYGIDAGMLPQFLPDE